MDSYIVGDIFVDDSAHVSPNPIHRNSTGGEPTLLGKDFLGIIQCLKRCLPAVRVSNGGNFKDWDCAHAIADVAHPDLMIGIPLFIPIMWFKQMERSTRPFAESSIRSVGVRVEEIRTVIHKLTYERLPDLAPKIIRESCVLRPCCFNGTRTDRLHEQHWPNCGSTRRTTSLSLQKPSGF